MPATTMTSSTAKPRQALATKAVPTTRRSIAPAAQEGAVTPADRPLRPEERRILRSVLEAPGRPNARLFNLESATVSPAGRLVPDIGRRHAVAGLVAAGLMEVILRGSVSFPLMDNMDGPGYIQLTASGLEAPQGHTVRCIQSFNQLNESFPQTPNDRTRRTMSMLPDNTQSDGQRKRRRIGTSEAALNWLSTHAGGIRQEV